MMSRGMMSTCKARQMRVLNTDSTQVKAGKRIRGHQLGRQTLGSQRASVDNLELGSGVIQKDTGIFLIKIMHFNAFQFSLDEIIFSQPLKR